MNTIFHQNENAVFEFSQKDIEDHIKMLTKEYYIEEPSKLFVLLDLIAAGKGSVICKVCGKRYRATELKPATVGHGKTPFDVNIRMKGGVKGLFAKKRIMPLYGGIAYECPANHELISAITWRT
jgi:hypothetical protein